MELPIRPEHGYVVMTLVATWLVHYFWMAMNVMNARKQYKVKYPALYAPAGHPNGEVYNCIQRAHQNSLENLPIFLALLLVAGARFPLTASAFGALYLAGRALYFKGYSSGNPEGREKGAALQFLGLFPLLITVIVVGAQLLRGAA